ncbi:galactokinase [Rhodovulum sp. 12E13]|uniref:galactokinase n=1 Tax=Rhodovulum sp. 12E13 TaxID=2203891 RepID=UPI000E174631|nr:galactokinase [Rhodovulum sp. 12E13]RDC67721.1 galactokinase [Rhodovulum sp. 12E13]
MTEDIADGLKARAARAFEERFGTAPGALAFAPGRVNLLGEHTDYNGGYVLPMPLALGTAIAIGPGGRPGRIRLASESFEDEEDRCIEDRASGAWSDYVLGCVAAAARDIAAETGLRAMIASNLPVGAGLSSSAAIEVCTLRALHGLKGKPLDPVEAALEARRVENHFVGMPCGIMDQFVVSVGRAGRALFLDTRRLTHREVALPGRYRVAVIHSGVSHKLTEDGYAARVAECNAACAALGVEFLGDLGPADLDRVGGLDSPLAERARHVITENQRVLKAVHALSSGDSSGFARLMIESHASQRDDYAVSVPEVDALVNGALDLGAAGARLTGGGFGGSVVAMVAANRAVEFCKGIEAAFPQARLLSLS